MATGLLGVPVYEMLCWKFILIFEFLVYGPIKMFLN